MKMPVSVPRRAPKKAKRPIRCCEVLSTSRITLNMQRVVVGGEALRGFTPGQEGANFKIAVPKPGQTEDAFRAELKDASAMRIVRTYTVQNYDPEANALTIDFAVHQSDHAAPACDWSTAAQPGDLLGVMGPGEKKITTFDADWYVLAADMSALPAVGAILADMPREAKGAAFFEITHADDIQDFDAPGGIDINWLVHPDPSVASTAQIDAVRTLDLPGNTQAIVVGEHSVVGELKSYLLDELGLDAARCYISPYWKIGLVEDEHQILKRSER